LSDKALEDVILVQLSAIAALAKRCRLPPRNSKMSRRTFPSMFPTCQLNVRFVPLATNAPQKMMAIRSPRRRDQICAAGSKDWALRDGHRRGFQIMTNYNAMRIYS